jgi:hypothetical protein
MGRRVTIVEQGRTGHVTYQEDQHAITGYWEFGGGDVVAIVAMGSAEEWRARHPWARDRRAEILRVIAGEVIRQRAPSCVASIDEASGAIAVDLRTYAPVTVTALPPSGPRPLSNPPRTLFMAAGLILDDGTWLGLSQTSEPLRVGDPDSVLMLHTSGGGIRGTLLVSRLPVDTGRLLWTQDTGLDRFTLAQILPGDTSTALVGTRPPTPDTVSEPLIVLFDHATGRLTTHSLWR